MAKNSKFGGLAGVLGISIVAVIVVYLIAAASYNMGYKNGVQALLNFISSHTTSSSGVEQ